MSKPSSTLIGRLRLLILGASILLVWRSLKQQDLVHRQTLEVPSDDQLTLAFLNKASGALDPSNTTFSDVDINPILLGSHSVNTSSSVSEELGESKAPRFAYAYVVGGVDPNTPNYRFYLYDIAISTYLQRQEGSTADVVLLVQMSYSSDDTRLPEADLRFLHDMQISISYIPKAKDESFYRTMLDKFRILSLTEYDRILFMDSDIMTFGSLDYLFELSIEGVLKENVVVAGYSEPANGGWFMLSPKETSHKRIVELIAEKEARGALLPYPHFDREVGWGHAFVNDTWKLINGRKSHLWDFHGAFADQGLLYYWVKYEVKSYSMIEYKTVYNWALNVSTGETYVESEIDLKEFESRAKPRTCWNVMRRKACMPPHRDYFHFTGSKKPWLAGPPSNWRDATASPSTLWFHTLDILNTKHGLGLNYSQWESRKRPLLGLYPRNKDVARTNYSATFTELIRS